MTYIEEAGLWPEHDAPTCWEQQDLLTRHLIMRSGLFGTGIWTFEKVLTGVADRIRQFDGLELAEAIICRLRVLRDLLR